MIHTPLPASLSHPGKLLYQELRERGRSQRKLADIIQKSPIEISCLIEGKREFSLEMALLIGNALGTGYEPWIGMQHTYDFICIRDKKSYILQNIKGHI